MSRIHETNGWARGREEFVLQVLTCGGDIEGCDEEVIRLVESVPTTIARARTMVVDKLMRGARG